MGRPRLDIGTHGRISNKEIAPGVHEAWTRFRFRNGKTRVVTRRASTGPKAETRLKKALVKLSQQAVASKISPETPFTQLLDKFLTEVERKVTMGKRAHKTLYDYRDAVDNHLRPALGDLTCVEAEDAGLCDEVLKDVQAKAAKVKGRGKTGTAAALRARTVLSGACAIAVRGGAMSVNPVKSVEKIEGDDNAIRALDPDDLADFLAKFEAKVTEIVTDPKSRLGPRARAWTDLPDVVSACLSTGGRPGEVLATVGKEIDPTERIVGLTHHVVREEGVGLYRKPGRKARKKGGEEKLWLRVPSWSVPMWRRRKLESGGGLCFPTWNGELEDPGNVAKRIKRVCSEIGYGWVSARILRHTTGTHLGASGLSDEWIADQLGNTPDVVRKNYRRPIVANARTADALESMLTTGG